MEPKDERSALSDPKSLAEVSMKVALEFALNQAESAIGRMEGTPARERLKARLEAFRRIASSWKIHPPTNAQVRLLLDHVAEARETAQIATPTVRVRRSA